MKCHIGTDTLSWAREGARVTGLDFSPNAIIEAERFAGILGFDDARFVVSRVSDAVETLGILLLKRICLFLNIYKNKLKF